MYLNKENFNQYVVVSNAPLFSTSTKVVTFSVTPNILVTFLDTITFMAAFNDYSERFLEVIEKLGFSDYKVWNEVESLSKATMSKIRRGLCGVSMNTLCDFIDKYPEVNADYIITGRKPMFIESKSGDSANESEVINQQLILKLQEELKEAYAEIGRLNMELKAAKEHMPKKKIG